MKLLCISDEQKLSENSNKFLFLYGTEVALLTVGFIKLNPTIICNM